MRLVGKAVKYLILNSNAGASLENRFYNALAPQGALYPLAVGRVIGVDPVDYKYSPNMGRACTETYTYVVSVYDFDIEQAAVLAQKIRVALDHIRPGPYQGIQISGIRFSSAEESAMREDDRDLFSWDLEFEIRADFVTDNI